jgi:hypothetical protein
VHGGAIIIIDGADVTQRKCPWTIGALCVSKLTTTNLPGLPFSYWILTSQYLPVTFILARSTMQKFFVILFTGCNLKPTYPSTILSPNVTTRSEISKLGE